MQISPVRKVPIRTVISQKNMLYRGVPKEYIGASLSDFELDEELNRFFLTYLTNIEVMYEDNVSIVMYGKNGNGKTWLSSLVVKEGYIYRFKTFRVTLQTYIDMHFKKDNAVVRNKMEEIENADFLVIDEVGKETFAKNQFNIIVLEELMRKRESLGKPTIICTNLPLKGDGGLYSQYGNSIKSLVDGNFVPLEFNDTDNRKSVTRRKRGIRMLMGED